jgi:HEAT repeat protein
MDRAGGSARLRPRERVEAACAELGRSAVVTGCLRLVLGQPVDEPFLLMLAGPAGRKFTDGRPHDDRYWLRVWGARGLLWCWDDLALPAIETALRDDAWRVREMALKVVARHRVGSPFAEVARLRTDPVPRVRAAAVRALAELTRSGA